MCNLTLFKQIHRDATHAFKQLKSEQLPLKDQLNKAQRPVRLIVVLHSVNLNFQIYTLMTFMKTPWCLSQESVHA